MAETITRRQLLKLGALSAGGLAAAPFPVGRSPQSETLARVATDWIYLYAEPSFRAKQIDRLERDEIITIHSSFQADEGPSYNALWYKCTGGYAHSGYLQRVRWRPQQPRTSIPTGGALFEISVPFTRSYRKPDPASSPLYRLYYQSTAWVGRALEGEDGRWWYELVDDVLHIRYFARAEHLRTIESKELTPLSPEVPLHQKRIEVSLARQELLAFERGQLILKTRISSGIPDKTPRENGIPTITPTGRFYVDKKMPLRHMGDGRITASLEAYELPGVPWVSYFHATGVAFHGTYWHNNFGVPMSHGCVNMTVEEAKWLFRWTLPAVKHGELLKIGLGTAVDVT
jgi:hypothetical protein